MLAAAGQPNATVFAAFAAGLLSFVSPCVLPLVPGLPVGDRRGSGGLGPAAERRPTSKILTPAIIFCLSFTAIFVALGMFATGLERAAAQPPQPARGDRRRAADPAWACSSC